MAKLLVIDDDRTVLRLVEKALENTEIEVFKAAKAAEGMSLLEKELPDVILLDVLLPEANGIDIAKRIRQIDSKLPIIFITALEDSDVAIEAMKLGAYDYLFKPLDIHYVQNLVERALENRRLMQFPVHLQEGDELPDDGDVLLGRSPPMLEVYKQIGRVAAQDVTVLIRGESGTGKELIARAIYQHSHRSERCFLAVNCAALSDTLLESELFGHEKGAFTGADRRHIGKFEQCSNGTIFLDEVGDMSPLTQSKVLRLLQEKKFERVGGSETIEVDPRLISATNRDLEEMIEDGEFRLDLYHRLNSFEIYLPPVRERGTDIELLTNFFINRLSQQLGKKVSGVSPEALQLLESYSWPGNVRELQSVIRKAILLATGPVIVPEFLPKDVLSGEPAYINIGNDDGLPSADLKQFVEQRIAEGSNDLYAETLETMERYLITRTLRATDGNQSKAAQQLGITRGSLRTKIRSLGISIGNVVTA